MYKFILKSVCFVLMFTVLFIYGARVVNNGEAMTVVPVERITTPDLGTEGKKSINEATRYDIKKIKGFGEHYADEIVKYRNAIGGFKGMEDLIDVSGIGEKRYEVLRKNFSI